MLYAAVLYYALYTHTLAPRQSGDVDDDDDDDDGDGDGDGTDEEHRIDMKLCIACDPVEL